MELKDTGYCKIKREVQSPPNNLLLFRQRANISQDNAIFIGDSDVDLQTGFNANLEVIGVSWGFKGYEFLKQQGAKYIAQTTSELYEHIITITNK